MIALSSLSSNLAFSLRPQISFEAWQIYWITGFVFWAQMMTDVSFLTELLVVDVLYMNLLLSAWLGFPDPLMWTCSWQMKSQRKCVESGNKHRQTWPRCYVRIENTRVEKASYLQRLQRPRERLLLEQRRRCKTRWPWCCPPAIILLALLMWRGAGVNRALRGGHESWATVRRVCAAGEKRSRRESPESTDPPAEPVVMYLPVVCTPSISSCFIIIITVCLNNVFICSYHQKKGLFIKFYSVKMH